MVNFSHNFDIDNSNKDQIDFKTLCTIPDTESWPQLTNMCELAIIEYNPSFDSIMPFPCFFDVTKNLQSDF
jgi:hypothetical protein